jgi:hypothetical protein
MSSNFEFNYYMSKLLNSSEFINMINSRHLTPNHRIDIGQKLHSWVKSVPECQPTSGVAAMLKATKPEEIL